MESVMHAKNVPLAYLQGWLNIKPIKCLEADNSDANLLEA